MPRPIATRLLLALAMVAGGTALPAPGATNAQSPAAREPARFSPVVFTDPLAGGVEALSLLVPEGWRASGGVEWLPAWSRAAHLATYVSDPETGILIAWLPLQDFIWFEPPAGFDAPIGGNYQGKAYMPPVGDPVEFVERFWMPTVLGHLRGATIVDRREVPAVAEEFRRGFGGPAEAGSWMLRYAYDRDGQPWEQDVALSLLWTGANGVTSWFVNFAYTTAGPAGLLDANQGTISTVIASRTTTPEWEGIYRLVQGLFYQGIQQQMADTVAFGEALARYRAETQALQAQVTAERQASQDRIAGFRRDILGGVENYDDPVNGGIVQLPVGWNQYWVNPQGEYLTVDDPDFDPNEFDNRGWQRLRPRDR